MINTNDYTLDGTIINYEITIHSDVAPFGSITMIKPVRIITSNCVANLQVPADYAIQFDYPMF